MVFSYCGRNEDQLYFAAVALGHTRYLVGHKAGIVKMGSLIYRVANGAPEFKGPKRINNPRPYVGA